MSSHMRLSHMDITLSISLRALADGKRCQTCIMIISKSYSNGLYHYVDCIGEVHVYVELICYSILLHNGVLV